jgi:Cytochrome P460
MKRIAFLLVAVATVAGIVGTTAPASGHAGEEAAPIFGVKILPGYRDWRLISVAHEAGNLNDFRAILGNDVAVTAFREGKRTAQSLPGWLGVTSRRRKTFGRSQFFVAGSKDSKKYAATGGWGFAQFKDGKPADESVHKTCFPCHEHVKARDFVFTHYAP